MPNYTYRHRSSSGIDCCSSSDARTRAQRGQLLHSHDDPHHRPSRGRRRQHRDDDRPRGCVPLRSPRKSEEGAISRSDSSSSTASATTATKKWYLRDESTKKNDEMEPTGIVDDAIARNAPTTTIIDVASSIRTIATSGNVNSTNCSSNNRRFFCGKISDSRDASSPLPSTATRRSGGATTTATTPPPVLRPFRIRSIARQSDRKKPWLRGDGGNKPDAKSAVDRADDMKAFKTTTTMVTREETLLPKDDVGDHTAERQHRHKTVVIGVNALARKTRRTATACETTTATTGRSFLLQQPASRQHQHYQQADFSSCCFQHSPSVRRTLPGTDQRTLRVVRHHRRYLPLTSSSSTSARITTPNRDGSGKGKRRRRLSQTPPQHHRRAHDPSGKRGRSNTQDRCHVESREMAVTIEKESEHLEDGEGEGDKDNMPVMNDDVTYRRRKWIMTMDSVVCGIKETWKVYANGLETRPLLFKCVTSAVIGALGDVTSQGIHRGRGGEPIWHDNAAVWRTLAVAIDGCFINAPCLHFAYDALERCIPAGNGVREATTQVAIDLLVFDPAYAFVFILTTGLLQGLSFEHEIWPTVKSNYLRLVFWLIVTGLVLAPPRIYLFGRFSVQWRVLISDLTDLLWTVLACLVISP